MITAARKARGARNPPAAAAAGRARASARGRAGRRAAHEEGVALIEALVAILIFSIGILAVLGMQAFSIGAVTDAKYRADASFLANQAFGQLWGDPENLASHAESAVSVDGLPNGTRTVEIDGRQATVTVRWQLPGGDEHQFVAVGTVNIDN